MSTFIDPGNNNTINADTEIDTMLSGHINEVTFEFETVAIRQQPNGPNNPGGRQGKTWIGPEGLLRPLSGAFRLLTKFILKKINDNENFYEFITV